MIATKQNGSPGLSGAAVSPSLQWRCCVPSLPPHPHPFGPPPQPVPSHLCQNGGRTQLLFLNSLLLPSSSGPPPPRCPISLLLFSRVLPEPTSRCSASALSRQQITATGTSNGPSWPRYADLYEPHANACRPASQSPRPPPPRRSI